ncbi:MAG: 3-deoxy-7-phosphoheptulonate synthase, partial [Gammaproteobacteria bacterium]|nr:3-deoxy-7-phosphoheptulonate synthase [Gammaproteobacteria bacterium]
NSNKDPATQPAVARSIVQQILGGNRSIVGIMLESHLHGGSQQIPDRLEDLRYGVSITDGCIDWDTTESLLLEIADTLRPTVPSGKNC